MGKTSALVGTYVRAGEIVRNSENLDVALANYDKTLRPFVDEIQRFPTWIIPILGPKTQLGIDALHFVLGLVAGLRVPELVNRFSKGEKRAGWKLLEYPELHP